MLQIKQNTKKPKPIQDLNAVQVGDWYWYEGPDTDWHRSDEENPMERNLYCVEEIGSNYIADTFKLRSS